MLDLHFFVRDDAVQVLTVVIQTLKERREIGSISVITGRGNHSRHCKAVLKPAVLTALPQLGVSWTVDDRNEGCVIVTL